jgi:DNA polymerase-3 subunit gamma/tau
MPRFGHTVWERREPAASPVPSAHHAPRCGSKPAVSEAPFLLAPSPVKADIVGWEVGGGQVPRQPGQVRKEAAVTSFGLGRSSSLPPPSVRASDALMTEPATAYRVLARKYRPTTFAELIGQEALVRTLSNAIATGRIAHSFILTGVRGTGKTTTARILARALNCIGPDGGGGPTITPCGVCEHCRSITEDRHVDVIEMDAASRTGVDNIRDLTDGIRYKPVSARYKVYIIDEVHMLSKAAFNALLKTLEEPPPDVKFIFATTEIQKVPVTVLSRCQRFSLRRIPIDLLAAHYARIAEAEGIAAEPAAIALIARAADGSARDGLSLLDQAIALGGSIIGEQAVRDMLGIADRSLVFDLLEAALSGAAPAALDKMAALYAGGADPVMVLQDLLELAHFLTRLKLVPSAGEGDPLVEGDRARGLALAGKLTMPTLTRAWQMLLKGLGEVQIAPSAMQAAEMVLVRLAYVADLPTPGEVIRAASEGRSLPAITAGAPRNAALPAGDGAGAVAVRGVGEAGPAGAPRMARAPQPIEPATMPLATVAPQPGGAAAPPQNFTEVVALFEHHREAVLRSHLWSHCHLVHFESGRIELRLTEAAPRDLPNRLGQLLGTWTGQRWVVSVSREQGAATLREQAEHRARDLRSEAEEHPMVRAVLATFPGATIEAVRELAPLGPPAGVPAAADPDESSNGEDVA